MIKKLARLRDGRQDSQDRIMLFDEILLIKSSLPQLMSEPLEESKFMVAGRRANYRSAGSPPEPVSGRNDFLPRWISSLHHQARISGQLPEFQAAVEDFLQEKPGLADEAGKALVVYFFLKNYIILSPDFADMSFRDKLAEAAKMAEDSVSQCLAK
jgi:hypothetical protein